MDILRAFGLTTLILVLAAPSSMGMSGTPTTVDNFSGGVHLGGWTYGRDPVLLPTGGNPDAYASVSLNSKLPQLAASGASVFTGDYRGRQVTHLGFDLLVDLAQTPGGARPVTLMLGNVSCTIRLELPLPLPQAGAGWVSYDIDLDPQSTTMPAGWQTFGLFTDPDTAWNGVMDKVSSLAILHGDPDLYSQYSFGDWILGADNMRLTEANPWADLGGLALLWIASSPAPFPALGGTVHAHPFVAQFFGATTFLGALTGTASMPAAPSGTEFTFQFICQDASTPTGLSLSNAVRGTVP